jgi:hypothetical protein
MFSQSSAVRLRGWRRVFVAGLEATDDPSFGKSRCSDSYKIVYSGDSNNNEKSLKVRRNPGHRAPVDHGLRT